MHEIGKKIVLWLLLLPVFSRSSQQINMVIDAPKEHSFLAQGLYKILQDPPPSDSLLHTLKEINKHSGSLGLSFTALSGLNDHIKNIRQRVDARLKELEIYKTVGMYIQNDANVIFLLTVLFVELTYFILRNKETLLLNDIIKECDALLEKITISQQEYEKNLQKSSVSGASSNP